MKKLNVFELKQVSGGDPLGARVPSVGDLLREVGLEVGLKYLKYLSTLAKNSNAEYGSLE